MKEKNSSIMFKIETNKNIHIKLLTVDFNMVTNFLKKEIISDKYSKYFVITVFIIFWVSYSIARFLKYQNYSQISIDILMHLSFIGLLYFLMKKHGKWTLIFALCSFLIISYSEIQSVWFLKTYTYLNWPSGILWTYPTTIGIGWVYLCYASYLLTNIVVLGRENFKGFVDGDNYAPTRPIFQQLLLIIFLAFIDGLILFHFGVLNETVGIDLKLWSYKPSNEPEFFGAPTKTLFTYFLASFIFNLFFRLIEYFMNNHHDNKTLSFNKSDIYQVYLFFLYWFFLIFESTLRFGINHWPIFVSLPILLIFMSITISKFYYSNRYTIFTSNETT